MATIDRTRLGELSLVLLLFLLFYALVFSIPNILFIHFDVGWHIMTGRITWETGLVPREEIWSSSARGHPLMNWYWLWEIVASRLFDCSGDFRLLFIWTAIQAGLVGGVVSLLLLDRGCDPLATFLVTCFFWLSWFLCTPLHPSITISPKTTSFLFFALSLYLLQRFSTSNSPKYLVMLSTIVACWVNTHRFASFVLPITGCYLLQDLVNKRWRSSLALCVSLAIGFFLGILLHPDRFKALALLLLPYADPAPASGALAFNFAESSSQIYIAAVLATVWFYRRQLPLVDRLHSLAWLVMGLKVSNSMPLFLIASVPLLAAPAHQLVTSTTLLRQLSLTLIELLQRKVVVAIMLLLTVGSGFFGYGYLSRLYPNGFDYPPSLYPHDGLAFLQQRYTGRSILTDWNFGGFIIHKTEGTLPVWVDGRSLGAYPAEVLHDFAILNTEPETVLEKYKSEVTFLRKQLPANLFLAASSEWRQVYADHLVTIFERIE